MEDQMVTAISTIASYGALGACTIYFMVKDWFRGKKTDEIIEKNTDVIKDFTVALNVLTAQGK